MCKVEDFTRTPDESWLGERINNTDARELFPQIKQSGINKQGAQVIGLKCGIGAGAPYPNMAGPSGVFYCEDAARPKNNQSMDKEIDSNRSIPLMVFIVGGAMFNYGLVEVACRSKQAGRNGWILKRTDETKATTRVQTRSHRDQTSKRERAPGTETEPSAKRRWSKGFEKDGEQYDSCLEYKHHLFFENLGLKHSREPLTLHKLGADNYSYTIDFLVEGVAIDPNLHIDNGPERFVYVEVKPTYPTLKEMERCESFVTKQRRPVLLLFGGTFAHPLEDDKSYHKSVGCTERYRNITKRKSTVRGWVCSYTNGAVVWTRDVYFKHESPDTQIVMLSQLRSSSDAHCFNSVYTNEICNHLNNLEQTE